MGVKSHVHIEIADVLANNGGSRNLRLAILSLNSFFLVQPLHLREGRRHGEVRRAGQVVRPDQQGLLHPLVGEGSLGRNRILERSQQILLLSVESETSVLELVHAVLEGRHALGNLAGARLAAQHLLEHVEKVLLEGFSLALTCGSSRIVKPLFGLEILEGREVGFFLLEARLAFLS